MTRENALVIYKNKPALVKDKADGKITISLQNGEKVKVRDKDIEQIHPGPVKDFSALEGCSASVSAIKEAWELLSCEDSAHSLKDLASLIFGEFSPFSAYSAYCLLQDGLYFCGTTEAVVPIGKEEVEATEAKRGEKERELTERVQFLERLKLCLKKNLSSNGQVKNVLQDQDARFMQDVEALAYGKSLKSRTMKEMELGETPQDAHALLLATGVWTGKINPHPARFGLSLAKSTVCPAPPPQEDRSDLCHLETYAIDSPWSDDPDDAISIENNILYVHIADPSSSVAPNSAVEKEARDRGATLYLPEGAVRMIAEEALPMFALGLSKTSPALTFKLHIDEGGNVTDTEIFPSVVEVKRISYEEADKQIETNKTLHALYNLAQRIHKRRTTMGAVNIELPDIHMTVKDGNVSIETIPYYRSSFIVRECMIAAGEGAGTWAASRGLAFPYISQEVELQGKVPGGLAGSYQLRRCMRPRILSTKPGRHQGLGLDTYTQVTSPLRRYTDLLGHIQIRAILRGEKPLSCEEVSAHLGFSEAGAAAAVQAERASENHWLMYYLSDKKDSVYDAVALEKKGNRWAVIIPSLALETQVSLQKDVLPNDEIKLILKSANIAKGEAVFMQNI